MLDHSFRYLQHEDRLTRYCLIGSGILCGLETYVSNNYYICVAPGTALTSDGHYVEVNSAKIFKLYRDFESESDYPLLDYELWELVEEADYEEGDRPLKPQNTAQKLHPFLKDKVVVLYTPEGVPAGETSEVDSLSSSHENGPSSSRAVQFLLIRQSDLLRMLDLDRVVTQMIWDRQDDDDDYIYSDAHSDEDEQATSDDLNLAVNPALRLQELSLLRFGFADGDPFSCPPNGNVDSDFPVVFSIKDIFWGQAADDKSGYVQVIDQAATQLEKEIKKLIHLFHPLLGKAGVFDPARNIQLLTQKAILLGEKWEAYKSMIAQGNGAEQQKIYYVQYFYDWMRDLINAYEELRCELVQLMDECTPDTNAFSNHVLLGMPEADQIIGTPRPLRHWFQQPPIYNGNAERRQHIRLYFWRLLKMIEEFYLPDYLPVSVIGRCNKNMDATAPFPEFSTIKITPGKFYDHPLSEQTIPYYYPVSANDYSIHYCWNRKRTKSSTTDRILSYHANGSDDCYTEISAVVHPLHYNLDKYNFYRIEGHIGQKIAGDEEAESLQNRLGVKNYLDMLIKKYNLDFSVLYFRLEEEGALTDDFSFPADFEHSREDLFNHWCKEIAYRLGYNAILGMEHLAGVHKGGTFIVLLQRGIAVADFSLPYRLQFFTGCENIVGSRTEQLKQERTDNLINGPSPWAGRLAKEEIGKVDPIETIKGIGAKTKEDLLAVGVSSYKQLSILKAADWAWLDQQYPGIKAKATKGNWSAEAAKRVE